MTSCDPLAGSPWSDAATVAGFAGGQPNPILLQVAAQELSDRGRLRVLDIGCGAGRNAIPLAAIGCHVAGLDLSRPMLEAARRRAAVMPTGLAERLSWALGRADRLPYAAARFDLVVAHGIWNLSRSASEFRLCLAEAARVAASRSALFVFTFSRHTLPGAPEPVHGEPFVFTQFSGQPQCFLTEEQLLSELGAVGFALEPGQRLREYNRAPEGQRIRGAGGPVIYEGLFRRG